MALLGGGSGCFWLIVQTCKEEGTGLCGRERILSLAVYVEEAGSDLCPRGPLLCDCAPNVCLLSLLVLLNCDNK